MAKGVGSQSRAERIAEVADRRQGPKRDIDPRIIAIRQAQGADTSAPLTREEALGLEIRDLLSGVRPFDPDPFDPDNINVPLISPSANFRQLEEAIVQQFTGETPFRQALRGDPGFSEARQFFNREVAPGIRSAFSGGPFGEGTFSGAARSAVAREGANFLFNERNNVFNRAFQAAGQLPGFAGVLDVDRASRSEQLARKIQVWAQEQGFEHASAQQAISLAGLGTEALLGIGSLGLNEDRFALEREKFEFEKAQIEEASKTNFGSIFGTAAGAIGGAFLGGPVGASIGSSLGGQLGGALGSGGNTQAAQGLNQTFQGVSGLAYDAGGFGNLFRGGGIGGDVDPFGGGPGSFQMQQATANPFLSSFGFFGGGTS